MVRHVRAVGLAVPYWDLVPVTTPTPTPFTLSPTGKCMGLLPEACPSLLFISLPGGDSLFLVDVLKMSDVRLLAGRWLST